MGQRRRWPISRKGKTMDLADVLTPYSIHVEVAIAFAIIVIWAIFLARIAMK